ncbi:uncharacterized protein ARMOST_18677 [Armillaria ostoyae]|uniref:Uncharacterized protein n=1 Tax=Armillaria ostoyae TaxID=47428 RepID=A0A284S2D5_ARMOS|nr:uncharacterized protein ARMOST_18677 [Armillaria ostoyae]
MARESLDIEIRSSTDIINTRTCLRAQAYEEKLAFTKDVLPQKHPTPERTGSDGKVIGDSASPSHINTVVRAPSLPHVDIPPPAAVPASSPMDSELSKLRVRTLYAYVADGPDGLSFDKNIILTANPSKTDGDWWFGTVVATGKSGLFPRTYVEAMKFVKVKALYTYTGNGSDELSFSEGDMITVVDDSGDVWWKVEQDGAVFLAPTDYLEVAEGQPPPLAPERLSSNTSTSSLKGLPPVPPTESETSAHLNDAFDRYEAFRYTHANVNRMSVASSMDSGPPSLPTFSTILQTPSKEGPGESRYSSIMHFLGRKTLEAEKRLVISAPILNSPESEFSTSASPAFGSSWASLVDKSMLEGIPPKERGRQEAIFELIATETAYVHDLQLVIEHFYSNMLLLLDIKAVTVVFANVEDILITNTTFMSALEEHQKDCRLYIDKIDDVLQSHMSNIAVYMEYCVNQSNAIKMLQSLRDLWPDLAAQLQHLRDDPAARNLNLSSYLLTPMQRITRYPLLVKQILHYTEPGGAEHIAIVPPSSLLH